MKTFRRFGAFALTMLMICLCLIVVAFTQDIQDENYTDYEPVQSIEQRQAVPELAARPNRPVAARLPKRRMHAESLCGPSIVIPSP